VFYCHYFYVTFISILFLSIWTIVSELNMTIDWLITEGLMSITHVILQVKLHWPNIIIIDNIFYNYSKQTAFEAGKDNMKLVDMYQTITYTVCTRYIKSSCITVVMQYYWLLLEISTADTHNTSPTTSLDINKFTSNHCTDFIDNMFCKIISYKSNINLLALRLLV